MRSQGKKLKEVVRIISGKYKIAESALYVDWNRRDTWGIVLAEPEETFVVQDYLQELQEVFDNLWGIATTAVLPDGSPDYKTRRRALKDIGDLRIRKLEADQELGRVHKEPMRIQFDEEVDRLYEAVKEVAGPDVETQKMVVRALMKYQHASGSSKN
jgi:hypothetical protein